MLDSLETIIAALKAARLKKGLSQRALSAKSGIPQSHISKIEKGEVDLQTSSLIEISRSLELELMLVPVKLLPTFRALLKGVSSEEQVPLYRLDEEEDV